MHKRRNCEEIVQMKKGKWIIQYGSIQITNKEVNKTWFIKHFHKISIEEESKDETKCQWWMFGEETLTPSSHKSNRFKQ